MRRHYTVSLKLIVFLVGGVNTVLEVWRAGGKEYTDIVQYLCPNVLIWSALFHNPGTETIPVWSS